MTTKSCTLAGFEPKTFIPDPLPLPLEPSTFLPCRPNYPYFLTEIGVFAHAVDFSLVSEITPLSEHIENLVPNISQRLSGQGWGNLIFLWFVDLSMFICSNVARIISSNVYFLACWFSDSLICWFLNFVIPLFVD